MATYSHNEDAGQSSERTSAAGLQRIRRWAADSRRLWLIASWLGLAFLLLLIALFSRDAGLSYDEEAQRTYGNLILQWYRSGFENTRATKYADLWLYGGLFDLIAQWITEYSPIDVFETRHILYAITALLGIVAAWLMAARIGGPRAGFLGALTLASTPVWIGHGLMNPKDVPFGAAVAFCCAASVRIAFGPAPVRIRDAMLGGFTAGLALAIRPGGVFVLGFPCLAFGLRLLLELLRRKRAQQPLGFWWLSGNLVLCACLVVIVAWPVMLSAWPWAQLDPIRRPFEAMEIARNFKWRAQMLYMGRKIYPETMPWNYLLVWFNITLPEIYLLATIAGSAVLGRVVAKKTWQGERAIGVILLVIFVALPLGAILYTQPVLYDAQRHVLFLLPPFAALAGVALSAGFDALWLPRPVRIAAAGVLAGLALLTAVDIVQLHPYQYTYFNRSSGGLKTQFKRFETDYWGLSYKEGLEWVLRELPPVHPARRTRVAACDWSAKLRLDWYVAQWPGAAAQVRIVNGYERADVFLGIRRYGCNRVHGKVLHVVRRQGAPLLYVRRTEKRR